MLGRSSAVDDSVPDVRRAPCYSPVCSRYSSGPSSSSRSASERGRESKEPSLPVRIRVDERRILGEERIGVDHDAADRREELRRRPPRPRWCRRRRAGQTSRPGRGARRRSSRRAPAARSREADRDFVVGPGRPRGAPRSTGARRGRGSRGRQAFGVQRAPHFVDASSRAARSPSFIDDEVGARALELGWHLRGDHVHRLGVPQAHGRAMRRSRRSGRGASTSTIRSKSSTSRRSNSRGMSHTTVSSPRSRASLTRSSRSRETSG